MLIMPTKKSLNDSWLAQFILGLSDEQYYCQDHNPDYVPQKDNNLEMKGEKLGTIEYNPITKKLSVKSNLQKD
jgi:hypothetical protein